MQGTSSERDVGVIFDDKLKYNDHVAEKINKTKNIMVFIRENFISSDAEMFKVSFVILVRPHIIYAKQVWCPHLVKIQQVLVLP